MNLNYTITYLACQSCTAKIHCEKCADELSERLMKNDSLQGVQIDIANRHISIQTSVSDEMDILDILEEIGIFAD